MSAAKPVADFEHLEPIPVGYGYAGILISVIFFQSVNQLLLRFGSPKSVRQEDIWKWRNLFVSWIHAVIIGTWDLSCFYRYPELMTDLIAFHNMYTYLMIAFSTGYFIYDFIDIVVNKQTVSMWAVIPHHFAVAGMFFYNVIQCRCIAYNVVALLAEVNSIFLHARKLLQMSGASFQGLLYRLNSAANLATFVGCRFLGLGWIVYGMLFWYDRVARVYFIVLGVAMFVMWVTNAILFWRLICSDLLRPRRCKVAAAKQNGGAGGQPCVATNGVANGFVIAANHSDTNLESSGQQNGSVTAVNGTPSSSSDETIAQTTNGISNGITSTEESVRRRVVDHASMTTNGTL